MNSVPPTPPRAGTEALRPDSVVRPHRAGDHSCHSHTQHECHFCVVSTPGPPPSQQNTQASLGLWAPAPCSRTAVSSQGPAPSLCLTSVSHRSGHRPECPLSHQSQHRGGWRPWPPGPGAPWGSCYRALSAPTWSDLFTQHCSCAVPAPAASAAPGNGLGRGVLGPTTDHLPAVRSQPSDDPGAPWSWTASTTLLPAEDGRRRKSYLRVDVFKACGTIKDTHLYELSPFCEPRPWASLPGEAEPARRTDAFLSNCAFFPKRQQCADSKPRNTSQTSLRIRF